MLWEHNFNLENGHEACKNLVFAWQNATMIRARKRLKEDGTKAKVEEKLNFMILEFNKGAKKIIVSHSRIHEDEKRFTDDKEVKVRKTR